MTRLPPITIILSPENKTYTISVSIPLTFTVDEFTSWIGYSVNGQPNVTITGNTTLPTLSDGWHYVVVYTNDTFGNMGASDIVHFTVDTTPPSGSITINDDAAYTNSLSVTLSLSAEDITSTVAQMRFSHDNVTWTPWEAYSASKAWTLTTGDGTKTVYVQYRDNAGLISPSYQDSITLDTTKPTANAGTDQTVNVGATVNFDAGASTDNVDIVSYEWDFGDGTTGTGKTTTHTYANTGTYTVTLTVKDASGNTATHRITITVLPVEAFPMWIVGAAAAAIAIAVAATILWRRRK